MTAMTQKERSARSAAKRAAAGERELRVRSRPGPIAKLSDLMVWHGIEEISEAVQPAGVGNARAKRLFLAAEKRGALKRTATGYVSA